MSKEEFEDWLSNNEAELMQEFVMQHETLWCDFLDEEFISYMSSKADYDYEMMRDRQMENEVR